VRTFSSQHRYGKWSAQRTLETGCLAIVSQSPSRTSRTLIMLCRSAGGTQSRNLIRWTDSLRSFSTIMRVPLRIDSLICPIDFSGLVGESKRTAKSSKCARQPVSVSAVARHELTREPANVHHRNEDPSLTSDVLPSFTHAWSSRRVSSRALPRLDKYSARHSLARTDLTAWQSARLKCRLLYAASRSRSGKRETERRSRSARSLACCTSMPTSAPDAS